MQEDIVYTIIGVAVAMAGVLFFRHFDKPQECAKHEGCSNCPLAQDCNKRHSD